jgi:hypothetical protein
VGKDKKEKIPPGVVQVEKTGIAKAASGVGGVTELRDKPQMMLGRRVGKDT